MKMALLLLPLLICSVQAQPLLPESASNHLALALQMRDISLPELQFDRDIIDSAYTTTLSREVLRDPLKLISLGDQAVAFLSEPKLQTGLWELIATLYDYPHAANSSEPPAMEKGTDYSDALVTFLTRVNRAKMRNDDALAAILTEERAYALAALLIDTCDIKSNSQEITTLTNLGLASNAIHRVFAENEWIDSRIPTSNRLAAVRGIDFCALSDAAFTIDNATAELVRNLQHVEIWPAEPITFTTNGLSVCIGTTNDDIYTFCADIMIDPAGNDSYIGAGAANGLLGHSLSIAIDLSGDDIYRDDTQLGCASGIWGIGVVYDVAGHDTYRANHAAQSCGLFGAGLLTDLQGNDIYSSGALSQGAGYAGFGILRDMDGNDTYTITSSGQAYAGVQGLGLLLDYHGNDSYTAGRVQQDYERHWENFVSLAQGFATGQRPFAGGGTAILFDAEGNDSYSADVYGQGVSYWYSIGMLLDLSGHDTYRMHEYGQGCGIHLSSAMLADFDGNDFYTGFSLAQGSAHDYAVGMLFDLQGNDTYTADHQSQGRAINNAFAMLMDQRGEDAYFARDPDSCQGSGNFPPLREYGSLALLLDLANIDFYSCGATNGGTLLRPFYGIVYDVETNPPLHSAVPVDDLPPPDLTSYSLDELVRTGSQYGHSEERRVQKKAATEQLKANPDRALPYLLGGLDKENMWFFIFSDNIVRELNPQKSANLLLNILDTTQSEKTQKMALFLLGYHYTPEHITRITPWITNDFTAGATIRTLGKWQATNTVNLITPYLQNTNERKRIIAANALHDIRSQSAAEALQKALHDPLFTVREAAKRAWTNLTASENAPTILEK